MRTIIFFFSLSFFSILTFSDIALSAEFSINPDDSTELEIHNKILKSIEDNIGPILNKNNYHELSEWLRELFTELSNAQIRILNKDVLIINRIYIVESNNINAFVYPLVRRGIDRIEHMVFITTAMLRKVFKVDVLEKLERHEQENIRISGVEAIIGILAHELGHPILDLNASLQEKISKDWKNSYSKQIIEILAHVDGAEILIEAGYPQTAIIQALKETFKQKPKSLSLVDLNVPLSTHPDEDLALASQRGYLTARRYIKGHPLENKTASQLSDEAIQQLKNMRWPLCHSLLECKKLYDSWTAEDEQLSEEKINFLVLNVDQVLAKTSIITDEDNANMNYLFNNLLVSNNLVIKLSIDKNLFDEITDDEITDTDTVEPTKKSEDGENNDKKQNQKTVNVMNWQVRKLWSQPPDVDKGLEIISPEYPALLGQDTHEQRIENIPYFSSENYINLIKNNGLVRNQSFYNLVRILDLLPIPVWQSQYSKDFAQGFASELSNYFEEASYVYSKILNIVSHSENITNHNLLEYKKRLMELLFSRTKLLSEVSENKKWAIANSMKDYFLNGMKEEDRVFFLLLLNGQLSKLLPSHSEIVVNDEREYNPLDLVEGLEIQGFSLSVEHLNNWLSALWQYKEQLLSMQLMGKLPAINWHLFFNAKKLTEEDGWQQLGDSFKQFLVSERFDKFIKYLREAQIKKNIVDPSNSVDLKGKNLLYDEFVRNSSLHRDQILSIFTNKISKNLTAKKKPTILKIHGLLNIILETENIKLVSVQDDMDQLEKIKHIYISNKEQIDNQAPVYLDHHDAAFPKHIQRNPIFQIDNRMKEENKILQLFNVESRVDFFKSMKRKYCEHYPDDCYSQLVKEFKKYLFDTFYDLDKQLEKIKNSDDEFNEKQAIHYTLNSEINVKVTSVPGNMIKIAECYMFGKSLKFYQIQLRAIESSSLSDQLKGKLVREVWKEMNENIDLESKIYRALYSQRLESKLESQVAKILKKYNVFNLFEDELLRKKQHLYNSLHIDKKDFEERREDILLHNKRKIIKFYMLINDYLQYVSLRLADAKELINRELNSQAGAEGMAEALLNVTKILLNPLNLYENGRQITVPDTLIDLKKFILQEASKIKMNLDSKIELFDHLTASQSDSITDDYYRKEILPEINKATISREVSQRLKYFIKSNRFSSFVLEMQVAEVAFEYDIQKYMENTKDQSTHELSDFIERFEELVVRNSPQKDKYLEGLSWRMNIDDIKHLKHINSLKSTNWKRINPIYINIGSLVTRILTILNYEDRIKLLDHLQNKKLRNLSDLLVKKLDSQIISSNHQKVGTGHNAIERMGSITSNGGESEGISTEGKIKNSSAKKIRDLIALIEDLKPMELVPIFEMALEIGERKLSVDIKMQKKIISKFLGHNINSQVMQDILSFLSILPEHERSYHLAYMLAVNMDKSSESEKSVFQMFGPMGIVSGQLGTIFGLIDKEMNDLKDKAAPPSKYEIVKTLQEQLGKEQYDAKVDKVIRLLGTASMNSAVLIRLKDGREIVALVQKPNAKSQILTNSAIMRNFVDKRKQQDKQFPDKLALSIIDAVETQLLDEMLMQNTAKKIKRANQYYEKLNKTMIGLKAWKFHVANLIEDMPVTDKVIFIEKVEGQLFENIKETQVQTHVGDLIARSSVMAYFREDWACDDRHNRNEFVDIENKVINIFDLGKSSFHSKSSPFSFDHRFALALLFDAIYNGKVNSLIKIGLKMSNQNYDKNSLDLNVLATDLQKVFDNSKDFKNRLIEIQEAFAANGVVFPSTEYMNWIKGFSIIMSENYVTDTRFKEIMRWEIGGLLLKKTPMWLHHQMNSCNSMLK